MIEKFSPVDILLYMLLLYLSVINIIAFIFMAVDKQKAMNRSNRIPERKLFFFAWIGGALGIFIGMKLLRHKTLHNSFRYGIPIIAVITYACTYYGYVLFSSIL